MKPFALEELLARLRALLRRSVNGADDGVLRFEDVEFDPATREVRRGDRRIDLTRTEFLLLELFLLNPRQVLTRSLVYERVWGYDFGPSSNALDVYIGTPPQARVRRGASARADDPRRRLRAARAMTFRGRLTLAAAAAVAVAIAVASLVVYLVMRDALRDEVDATLRERADVAQLRGVNGGAFQLFLPPMRFGGGRAETQIVAAEPGLFRRSSAARCRSPSERGTSPRAPLGRTSRTPRSTTSTCGS